MTVPLAKLPHTTLPTIGGVPTIPHVGSAGANGTTYVGTQFGNLPDLHAAVALKTIKKALIEQVYALIQGELPFVTRPPIYAARAAQLVTEIADVTATLADVVASVTSGATAARAAVLVKRAEMNAARAVLEGISAGARSPVQSLMIARYTRYAAELEAQAERLQTTIDTISA
jgi:hypothetical protein